MTGVSIHIRSVVDEYTFVLLFNLLYSLFDPLKLTYNASKLIKYNEARIVFDYNFD